MKKIVVIIIILLINLVMLSGDNVCLADTDISELEKEIETTIDEQISDLDLTSIENALSDIGTNEKQLFSSNSFTDKLKQILNGQFNDDSGSFFKSIINLVFEGILDFIPLLASVVAVAIICSFISSMRSQTSSKGVGDIIHFICFGVVIAIIVGSVVQIVNLTSSTLFKMKNQMEAIFPLLLTLLTALGGTTTVGLFQPSLALLSGTIMTLFTNFVLPIFIFSFVFSIIANLSSSVKLDKFSSFFSSLFKYVIGFIFTIFSAFLAIKGISANSFDGISFKTAKYAIKSYVPMLGGYLSDGLDIILTSSLMIKNSLGLCGLLLLFATIIVPLVKIIVFILALKLTAAILEPVGDEKISNFIHSVSKSLSMLVVMILGVSFMFILSVGLLIGTASYIL